MLAWTEWLGLVDCNRNRKSNSIQLKKRKNIIICGLLLQSIRTDLPFLQQRALFCALGRSVMPALSLWRYSGDIRQLLSLLCVNNFFSHKMNTGSY